jgi:protein-S-isoprenylcysteine O-methyltransferase Ste14
MESMNPKNNLVHFILLHSYIMFLLAVIMGVIFDVFFPVQLFHHYAFRYLGVAMLLIGPWVIYWAQSASAKHNTSGFEHGPYKYSRNPTHLGLAIMTLGFAFLINSLFSVIFLIIASLISKFFFLPLEEKVLEKKYDGAYAAYKKKVNTWV